MNEWINDSLCKESKNISRYFSATKLFHTFETNKNWKSLRKCNRKQICRQKQNRSLKFNTIYDLGGFNINLLLDGK